MKTLPVEIDLEVTTSTETVLVRADLDFTPAISQRIRARREDCVPGRPAFCQLRSFRVVAAEFGHGVSELRDAVLRAIADSPEQVAQAVRTPDAA